MMQTFRQYRWFCLWLSAVMLLGALAPAVSQFLATLAASPNSGRVLADSVCTAQGVQAVKNGSSSPVSGLPGSNRCPLCVLCSERLVPPPAPFVWQGMPQAPLVWSFSYFLFLYLIPCFWGVQARAPPA